MVELVALLRDRALLVSGELLDGLRELLDDLVARGAGLAPAVAAHPAGGEDGGVAVV